MKIVINCCCFCLLVLFLSFLTSNLMAKVLITGTSMLVVAALLAILKQKLSAKFYEKQYKDLYDDQLKIFMKISTIAKILMTISTIANIFMKIIITWAKIFMVTWFVYHHLRCSRHHDKNEEEYGNVGQLRKILQLEFMLKIKGNMFIEIIFLSLLSSMNLTQ